PVIAATGSCLEEAGGEHSIYVSPNDEKEMAKAIDTVWNDNTARQKMIDEGLKHAKKFEDNVITNQILNVYSQLIK
ncbi:MAG: glycosyltransferase family 1 protein, partial [Bacteroides sp.]|nr:glycosyltransferase family 1 protein [Bacteroides sp.]